MGKAQVRRGASPTRLPGYDYPGRIVFQRLWCLNDLWECGDDVMVGVGVDAPGADGRLPDKKNKLIPRSQGLIEPAPGERGYEVYGSSPQYGMHVLCCCVGLSGMLKPVKGAKVEAT